MPVHAGSAVESAAKFERAYYAAPVGAFLQAAEDQVLGRLTKESEFSVDLTQRDAWRREVDLLKAALPPFTGRGRLYLEFVVPRLGKRIDAVLLLDHMIFVIEFKVGEKVFRPQDLAQVWDYALDLKNFHESSHAEPIAPILVVTGVSGMKELGAPSARQDGVLQPSKVSADRLGEALIDLLGSDPCPHIESDNWDLGRYRPTPTIVEAATSLYRGHSVANISRHGAEAINLTKTSAAVSEVIALSKARGVKSICLVTGVPGAGKTLVGLDVATRHLDPDSDLHCVYLSGNGPLVSILREALARDDVVRAKDAGKPKTKGAARQAVKAFIQPIHHFRDECLKDLSPPAEHVTIFDEAQRAWNLQKTADFMHRKKGRPGFAQSEPAFLISCLDRHPDWAVVVCLIGGGQEINTGEAGISEWIDAILTTYPHWHLHVSPELHDSEYGAQTALNSLQNRPNVFFNGDLHLSVSMRSYRASNLSNFVKLVLDLELQAAAQVHAAFADLYPIVLTRSVEQARAWLRSQARGSERYGMVVSSQAQRLKPHAIDVRTPVDPVNWFLNDRDDVRSSFYLEDVATEFQVQGLELDWACVVWDADFRFSSQGWEHHSFVGNRWQHIRQDERKAYLKNAYRVLLTRARQGMVIVVPEGSAEDATRSPSFYDTTFDMLRALGLPLLA